MGKSQSPGPIYMLPPTVGYNKHDASRYRNPQYSISPKLYASGIHATNPGPQYEVRGLTEHGKQGIPAYTIKSRPKTLAPFNPPGPGAYSPEKAPRMKEARPPAYTMQGRYTYTSANISPGPAYNLPSMLGPKVPNKPASEAYTMTGKPRGAELQSCSPGPATYQGTNTDIYKNKRPQYTMGGNYHGVSGSAKSPGPAAYVPKKLCGEHGPRFTISGKYDEIYTPYITPEDNMPCVDR